MLSTIKQFVKTYLPVEPWELKRLYDIRDFLWMQRTKGFDIPSSPVFDDISTEFFSDHIRTAKFYLEYGSGGSTRVAAKFVQTLVSVDCDKYFLSSLSQLLAPKEDQTIKLLHANIGLTQHWGVPVFHKMTPGRARLWANYCRLPWHWLNKNRIQPDTILVDGRFRVACVLESLRNIENTDKCAILVDDYEIRLHYHVIEEFCDLVRMHGRMAEFVKKRNIDVPKLEAALGKYQYDYR